MKFEKLLEQIVNQDYEQQKHQIINKIRHSQKTKNRDNYISSMHELKAFAEANPKAITDPDILEFATPRKGGQQQPQQQGQQNTVDKKTLEQALQSVVNKHDPNKGDDVWVTVSKVQRYNNLNYETARDIVDGLESSGYLQRGNDGYLYYRMKK